MATKCRQKLTKIAINYVITSIICKLPLEFVLDDMFWVMF